MLSLRQDSLKPPATMVKRLLKQRQQVIESERGQLLSAAALRDLKAILVAELRKTTPPKVRTVDVVWNLDEERLAIYTHAKSMNEALLALFFEIPHYVDRANLGWRRFAQLTDENRL